MTMLSCLRNQLQVKLENAVRIAVLGVGSDLRGDDAVGMIALSRLRELLKAKGSVNKLRRKRSPVWRLFEGGTAPENLTGDLRRFKPSHLLIIDAAELGKKPGTIEFIDLKKADNTSFLTHKLPLKLTIDYLAADMKFSTVFLGIQPRSLDFGAPVSEEVSRAGKDLAALLKAVFQC